MNEVKVNVWSHLCNKIIFFVYFICTYCHKAPTIGGSDDITVLFVKVLDCNKMHFLFFFTAPNFLPQLWGFSVLIKCSEICSHSKYCGLILQCRFDWYSAFLMSAWYPESILSVIFWAHALSHSSGEVVFYIHFVVAILIWFSPFRAYLLASLIFLLIGSLLLAGTQRVISFLRQMMEHGGFYRTSDQAWIKFERIQFVGACNPPTDPGRKPLSYR